MNNIFLAIRLWLVYIFTLPIILFAQSGSLDLSFGSGGMTATTIHGSDDIGESIAIQSDGKIVAVGYTKVKDDWDIALCRYNKDGSLDNSFGYLGRVYTDIKGSDDYGEAIKIQNDGKILVAGSGIINSKKIIVVARYMTDGLLDGSFGTNGIVITDLVTNFGSSSANEIVVQSNGKIVVVGYAEGRVALLRYNSNGSLDASFDSDGIVTTGLGPFFGKSYGNSIVIQADGKIVVTGTVESNQGAENRILLLRYIINGTLDGTFGTNGIITANFDTPNSTSFGNAVVMQTDGKIVIAATRKINNLCHIGLVRFNNNGGLDLSFGSNGKSIAGFSGSSSTNSVIVQSNGKILVGGSSDGSHLVVARFNSNGSLGNTFDSDGKQQTYIGTETKGGGLAIQGDGKILIVAGCKFDNNPDYDITLSRYNINGALDFSFSTDGIVNTSIAIGGAEGWDIAIQNDGKIVAVASRGDEIGLIRLNINGSFDQLFGDNGKRSIGDFYSFDGRRKALEIQSDGGIVVAGSTFMGNGHGLSVIRLNSNGDLDGSFGGFVNGRVTIPLGEPLGFDTDLKIGIEGKILISYTKYKNGFDSDFAAIRLNSNGTIDNSFGVNGIASIDFENKPNDCSSIAVQSNGKIILVGTTSNNKISLVRLNVNGSLDNTFGILGKVTSEIVGSLKANSVILQKDNKIAVVGGFKDFNGSSFIVLRYNISGSLDNTFGNNGYLKIPISDTSSVPSDIAKAVALQNDGKIVICGALGTAKENAVGIVRCNSNGILDLTFGDGGKIITRISGSWSDKELGRGIALQQDGKILAVGSSEIKEDNRYAIGVAVFRYNNTITSSSEDLVKEKAPILFPNPTTGLINITSENNQIDKLELFSLNGDLNHKIPEIKDNSLDLSHLPHGSYILKGLVNNYSFVKKVIIVR